MDYAKEAIDNLNEAFGDGNFDTTDGRKIVTALIGIGWAIIDLGEEVRMLRLGRKD